MAVADVVLLNGGLAAGKTFFVAAAAAALGSTVAVTSPTYTIANIYPAPIGPIVHIDAYRIEEEDEMRPLHFKELLGQPNTLICIEWAEKITNLLPDTTQHLTFSITDSGRIIELS